tara:strand:+ start:1331 stop:9388 length:8058 start_codon:yes stop_codon:yes gene_type:complete
MPEIKNVFSKALMNKDMDERLVPAGQYRDALNIQIATSDGSDVGAVQTISGNTKYSKMLSSAGVYDVAANSTCVASIADASKDKLYYFVHSGKLSTDSSFNDTCKDYILEYDTLTGTHRYVFVDIYKVKTTIDGASANTVVTVDLGYNNATDITGIRRGMLVTGTFTNNTGANFTSPGGATIANGNTYTVTESHNVSVDILGYESSKRKYTLSHTLPVADGETITFVAPSRALGFSKHNIITGINILDDSIYWTDNYGEPKKINIRRCMAGTGGTIDLYAAPNETNTFEGDTPYFHTRLTVGEDIAADKLKTVYGTWIPGFDVKAPVYVDESHITVIKKAPTQPLDLEMYRTNITRVNSDGVENLSYATTSTVLTDTSNLTIQFNSGRDFREGDVLLFVDQNNTSLATSFTNSDARGIVVGSNATANNLVNSVVVDMQSISANIIGATIDYYVRLEDSDPLFEFKLPRFSYRYKYEDGEYSTFAPWSRIAFLPANYEYLPKKGYNFGMVNQIRGLKLKQYHGNKWAIPQDVIEVDLLYKETNNPTVYTVKTVKPGDVGAEEFLWPSSTGIEGSGRGEYKLTTDMIHAVVPSNQLLRPWDNVPRKALAQEVSANRLIYGNYLQNYTVLKDPIISVGLVSGGLGDEPALPSVKSLRTYQMGVVFSDGYGRETPVLTNENSSIRVPKNLCGKRNRIECRLKDSSSIPEWAKYYSYYVKETSVEYYTLAMDRWYDAFDGNIWLSFPSSDRNKVDEETFLELKKSHGQSKAVVEKARYKVLAIESEAPDFIKIEKKSLGRLYNTQNAIGSPNFGFPTIDSQLVTIDSASFENTYGTDFLLETPENLSLILYGANQQSKEYAIGAVTQEDNLYRIQLVDKFGVDISFTSTNNSYSGAIDDLSFVIFEGEVKNKPEFDGRFFVKIFKDAVLQNNILNSVAPENWVVDKEYQISYLNNNGYKYNGQSTSSNALGNYHLGSTFGDSYSGDPVYTTAHPTENYYQTQDDDGVYHWGDFNTPANSWQVTPSDIDGNPVGAINEKDGDYGNAAEEFWRGMGDVGTNDFKCLFIDAATAYSWNGREGNMPGRYGLDNDTGQFWDFGNQSAEDNQNDQDKCGNMASYKGQPSRGIWKYNDNCFMDVSWTRVHGEDTDNNTGSNNNYSEDTQTTLEGSAEFSPAAFAPAWDFVKTLVTPGTRFRFKRDPDQFAIYETGEVPHPTAGIGFVFGDANYPGPDFNATAFGNTINTSGYSDGNIYSPGTSIYTGAFGIRNWVKGGQNNWQMHPLNLRQRWTINVTPEIGYHPSGPNGYSPVKGTVSPENGSGPVHGHSDYRRALRHDGAGGGGAIDKKHDTIQIMVPFFSTTGPDAGNFTDIPAVWETEPKESVDLDIYYQASGLIPLDLNIKTNEELLPIGSTFKLGTQTLTITEWDKYNRIKFEPSLTAGSIITDNQLVRFTKRDNYSLHLTLQGNDSPTDSLYVNGNRSFQEESIHNRGHILDWNNCWSFGNGVESDRIRDDYNAPQMDNGVKASTVIAEPVREEKRKHGLIWSGIYNSTAGVNNTNQFIMAEAITKDLNPIYGSIQALLNRDTRLMMFCEDKILRAQTNKDALYNADGKPQVVASNAVVGDVTPYQGDYGISTNPESIVATPYQVYFTDVVRGQVLAISGEGVRSISDIGMRNYFLEEMNKYVWRALGTHDERKNEYNLTISKKYRANQEVSHGTTEGTTGTTISYSERSKGWVSFKSFIPQNGLSANNDYYTFDKGHIYKHHDTSVDRNNFYGLPNLSNITTLFNGSPNAVKNFATINYEGSQAKVTEFDSQAIEYYNNDYSANGTGESNGLTTVAAQNDGEYFNLSGKPGWYVDNITTNLQRCGETLFKEKEGKWFAAIVGGDVTGDGVTHTPYDLLSDIPTNNKGESTVQGIGLANITHSGSTGSPENQITLTVANNVGTVWDNADTLATENSRWTCTTASFQEIAGTIIISADKVNLTVSPVVNGVNSNFPLYAANLLIENATASTSVDGTEYIYTTDSDTYVTDTGGADWEDIEKITFKDLGTPGDPNNTVNVEVQFKADRNWPAASLTYYIDIDDAAGVSEVPTRKTCLLSRYARHEGLQAAPVVADVAGSDILESITLASGVVNGAGEVGPTNKHAGTVPGTGTSEVGRVTFARTSPQYYGNISVKWENLGAYENHYTYSVDETFTGGVKTGFTVRLFYTPPQEGELMVDPEDFCSLGHSAHIVYDIITPDSPPGEGPDGVDTGLIWKVTAFNGSNNIGTGQNTSEGGSFTPWPSGPWMPSQGGVANVVVTGDGGSNYNLHIQKKTSVDSDITASTNGYYNPETAAFQTAPVSIPGTIPASGTYSHGINIPSATANTRYDVTVDGGPINGVLTTLGEPCPTQPGELMIPQNGIYTVTIDTEGIDHEGNVIVADSVIKPVGFSGSGIFTKTCMNLQGIHAIGSTRLILKSVPRNLRTGSYVINPFGQTLSTVNAIQHLTTVTAVNGNVVTIDKATQVAFADDDQVCFLSNNGSVKPFEVQVTKGGSEPAISAIKTSVAWEDTVGGLNTNRGYQNDAAVDNARAFNVTPNTRGLYVGMKVTSPTSGRITNAAGGDFTFITAIGSLAQITLEYGQTMADDTSLRFSSGDGSGEAAAVTVQEDIKLLHIQAHMKVAGSVAKIQGYLRIHAALGNSTIQIYSDAILTQ